MEIAAVIFDLNGTVLADEDEYGAAFRKVLAKLGRKIKKEYPHVGGIGVKENWPILLSKYKIKTNKTVEELTKETQDAYIEQLKKVTVKKGFDELVRDLKESGILVGLATSNAWWIVEEVFDELKLDDVFDSITTGEEVEYKKPDPDIFNLAAQKMGVEPDACLVFEDSAAGIESASRAGMRVVGIARDAEHAKTLSDALFIINDFFEVTPERLKQI